MVNQWGFDRFITDNGNLCLFSTASQDELSTEAAPILVFQDGAHGSCPKALRQSTTRRHKPKIRVGVVPKCYIYAYPRMSLLSLLSFTSPPNHLPDIKWDHYYLRF